MVLPLVVGADGSQSALRAVDWAVDEAARHGLPLRIVHASLWERYEGAALKKDTPEPGTALALEHALAESVVAQAAERARRRGPTTDISTDLLPEDATSALLRESRDATAVVIGGRERGLIGEFLLGGIGDSLAARAYCPVVAVRGSTGNREAANGRVVVGVGGSATGPAAVRFAFREAAVRGCELEAVRVWRGPAHRAAAHPLLTGEPAHHQEDQACALLEDALDAVDDLTDEHSRPVVHRVVAEGSVRQVLLARSAAADLLVIGAHRRHGHLGPRLGRVEHAMLHHADCPVAVVPQRQDGLSGDHS
jgi:nucleotide-binding universal stress UspA family protein